MLAQTVTALPEMPTTGIDKLDRVIGVVVLALASLSAFVKAAQQLKARADILTAQFAQLFGAAKAVVTGVEVSRADIVDVLAEECAGCPPGRIEEIAGRIHDRLTARIQKVSEAARVEPVLAPIVKETKSALRAVNADGEAATKPQEGPR